MGKALAQVMAAGIWITISEFVRNELLLKDLWIGHFAALGLGFETLPLSGMLWMVWSFLLAYLVFRLSEKTSFAETVALAWLPAFAMMWIALFNLQVLPLGLLIFAAPLSLLEVGIAAAMIERLGRA